MFSTPRRAAVIVFFLALSGVLVGLIPMTLEDFHVPGTQVGDAHTGQIWSSQACMNCHGTADAADPYQTWRGSLMALGGRDPLFFAQVTTANQDVENVGYYCLRCHVPGSIVSGTALDASGATLTNYDRDGVSCHFCHSMVDPIFKPGVSPPADQSILAALDDVPQYYGNAAFVLDPEGSRRGPRLDHQAMHEMTYSPFHTSGDFCGTCHDVGNLATSKQANGTYRYNAINQRSPTTDPWQQFPLERTYTEWKLSTFAATGVDMGGRFGGVGGPVVSSCQDCHMPRVAGNACAFGPERADVTTHDFAGSAVGVLQMIALENINDPEVDQDAVAAAIAKSIDMLHRAASVEVAQVGSSVRVRVINESGHKIPTGHIEGRRIWVNVKMLNASGAVVREYGAYDLLTATLDEASTEIYEMHVGLSDFASTATGLPPGPTGHMALADTIVKDNRIPPRGFNNAAFEAGGAPVVAHEYADGQYWDDSYFAMAPDAVRAEATVLYQNLPRDYIEHLRDANHTNNTGQNLFNLWTATGRGAPVPMVSAKCALQSALTGDCNGDGAVNGSDLAVLLTAWNSNDSPADLNGDRLVDGVDFSIMLANWGG